MTRRQEADLHSSVFPPGTHWITLVVIRGSGDARDCFGILTAVKFKWAVKSDDSPVGSSGSGSTYNTKQMSIYIFIFIYS